jgi:DNA-3-methyladenine glycosylase I
MRTPRRCWPTANPLLTAYHDREWGVPVHEDQRLFEGLVLQTMQAGLSWTLVLAKRAALRTAFDGFRPGRIARYGAPEIRRLLGNPAIIRNRAKIEATIQNARAFARVREAHGTFDRYVWRFVNGRTVRHHFRRLSAVPDETRESRALSNDLRRWGFRFVGPVVCYSFMQAAGLVNDHLMHCFRWRTLR